MKFSTHTSCCYLRAVVFRSLVFFVAVSLFYGYFVVVTPATEIEFGGLEQTNRNGTVSGYSAKASSIDALTGDLSASNDLSLSDTASYAEWAANFFPAQGFLSADFLELGSVVEIKCFLRMLSQNTLSRVENFIPVLRAKSVDFSQVSLLEFEQWRLEANFVDEQFDSSLTQLFLNSLDVALSDPIAPDFVMLSRVQQRVQSLVDKGQRFSDLGENKAVFGAAASFIIYLQYMKLELGARFLLSMQGGIYNDVTPSEEANNSAVSSFAHEGVNNGVVSLSAQDNTNGDVVMPEDKSAAEISLVKADQQVEAIGEVTSQTDDQEVMVRALATEADSSLDAFLQSLIRRQMTNMFGAAARNFEIKVSAAKELKEKTWRSDVRIFARSVLLSDSGDGMLSKVPLSFDLQFKKAVLISTGREDSPLSFQQESETALSGEIEIKESSFQKIAANLVKKTKEITEYIVKLDHNQLYLQVIGGNMLGKVKVELKIGLDVRDSVFDVRFLSKNVSSSGLGGVKVKEIKAQIDELEQQVQAKMPFNTVDYGVVVDQFKFDNQGLHLFFHSNDKINSHDYGEVDFTKIWPVVSGFLFGSAKFQ